MAKRRLGASFSARTALIGLEIRQDSCVQSPCLAKKSAPIQHSANFQTRPNLERKKERIGFRNITSGLSLPRSSFPKVSSQVIQQKRARQPSWLAVPPPFFIGGPPPMAGDRFRYVLYFFDSILQTAVISVPCRRARPPPWGPGTSWT